MCWGWWWCIRCWRRSEDGRRRDILFRPTSAPTSVCPACVIWRAVLATLITSRTLRGACIGVSLAYSVSRDETSALRAASWPRRLAQRGARFERLRPRVASKLRRKLEFPVKLASTFEGSSGLLLRLARHDATSSRHSSSTVPTMGRVMPSCSRTVPVERGRGPRERRSMPTRRTLASIDARKVPSPEGDACLVARVAPILARSVPMTTRSVPVLTSLAPILARSMPMTTRSVPVLTSLAPILARSMPDVAWVKPSGSRALPSIVA
jgi:hypothetical protein